MELNDELGLNTYDYGARMYDPTIGRFMNIDRYSESFMPISTYQYGANNPILYLDYNGDYITIGIEDDDGNKYSVLYENGQAYHYSKDKDGNVTKGGEYDGNAKFVSKALKDLNKVGNTKQGGRIIGRLQNSSDQYNIENSGDARSPGYLNNTISYNPDKNYGFNDGVSFGKSFINLGHELAHAYDDDRGFDISSMALGGYLPASEINAVNFENYLRASDGESLMRLNYTYKGKSNNLRGSYGGSSADYFKSYIAPLGVNEEYRMRNSISPRDRSGDRFPADNTRVKTRTRGITGVYDTKKKKFTSN